MMSIPALYDRVGRAHRSFDCCDTDFRINVMGVRATAAARQAEMTAYELETQLNAFDPDSAVTHLNETGSVTNEHVAAVVERGLAYMDRTNGRFDIRQGDTEHALKSYLRGETDTFEATFTDGTIIVDGQTVEADVTVDLNGLAKGYIVDRATDALRGIGRRGYVNGGGDMTPPTKPITIESPYGDSKPLRILDTDWAIASSGDYNRSRDGTDHIYDPVTERTGANNELVTVLARRDCMEADAMATTLATMHPETAIDFATDWPDIEAFLVHNGVFHETPGIDDHVYT